MFYRYCLLFRYFLSILFNNIGATIQERKLIGFASLIIATGGALVGTALLEKGNHSIIVTIIVHTKSLASWTTYIVVEGSDCQYWNVSHSNR